MSGSPAHVAVVGGGIAGLATAFSLQERAAETGTPLACTLIESDRTWGGKILTHRVGDALIEAGPDSFLSQKPWALQLCAKLGLSDRLMNSNEAQQKTYVFSRGRLRELPEGLVVIAPAKLGSLLRSGILSWPGVARMAMDLVLPARRAAGDESLASFFRRRLGREAFERLIEPLMAGIYAGDAEQISLKATFPRFLEMEREYGSLIRGMLAGRKTAPPSGLSSAPARSMFVTLRDGLGEMVRVLVARIREAGATMLPEHRVMALRVRSTRPGTWTYDLLLENGRAVTADAVVLATPAYVTADLVRPLTPTAAGTLEAIPYGTARSADKIQRAREFGLQDGAIVAGDPEAMTAQVQRWTSNRGVDVVLDTIGGDVFRRSMDVTRIGGKLVAANRGDVVKVSGDGKSTVRELIDLQINCDPRRGPTENHPLSIIRIDSAARIELERQGLTGDSVPAAGVEVLIQRNANHEFDVTDEVHPETAALASLAARIVGLDIAGIDLVAEDTLESLTRALDAVGEEIDPDFANGILRIEFGEGPPYVINSHRAARQIWLAAERSAAHYSLDKVSGAWLDDKTGEELFTRVEKLLSEKLRRAITLERPKKK